MRTINKGAFNNTAQLKTLNLPSTLTTLNSSDVEGNNQVTYNATFYGSGITELDLSNTQITTINNATFMGATSLESVTLPAGLTTIGEKAFKDTTLLKTLTQKEATGSPARADSSNKLTKSITSIGNYAFQNTGLVQLDLDATNITTSYNESTHTTHFGNSIFQGATRLNDLKLPNGLLQIPAGLVAGAIALQNLNIPTSVTKINGGNDQFPGAFQGSGITNLDLSVATGLAT